MNLPRNLLPRRVPRLVAGFLAVLLMAGLLTAHVPSSAAAAPFRDQSAQGDSQPRAVDCESLEDCYDYSQMDEFLALAWGLVRAFAHERYGARLFDVKLRYVGHGERGAMSCTDSSGKAAEYSDRSYAYCPPDNTIYIGQDELWKYYSQLGDAAAVVGLAHEFGHSLQTAHDVPSPRTSAEFIPLENQADCIAGAWFAYIEALGSVEADDIDDLAAVLEYIGSSEDDENRDHGTTAERTASLELGRTEGLRACNAFFPDSPVYSSQELEDWDRMLMQLREGNAWVRSPRRQRR